MYKIFFENRALFFINVNENDVFSSNAQKIVDAEKQKQYTEIIINWLNNNEIDTIIKDALDADILTCALKSIFKMAPAAGGVVCQDVSFVSIVRNGVPDLPKGHIEKGETPSVAALREVEEETGIECEIMAELPSTWHCYKLNGQWVLKQTFWYQMKPVQDIVFTPQQEEGITEVVMVGKEGVDAFLSKTYRSISEIIGPNLRYFVAK